MLNRLTEVTAPADLALDLGEVKRALRITDSDEDTYLQDLIREATEFLEARTGRQLVDATYDQIFDNFVGAFKLWLLKPPLKSVVSINYQDENDVTQLLATTVYEVVTTYTPGFIRLKENQVWPSTRSHPDSVTVQFIAGYGTAADVPYRFRQAIKLYVAHRYENREPYVLDPGLTLPVELPMGLQALVTQLSVRGVG